MTSDRRRLHDRRGARAAAAVAPADARAEPAQAVLDDDDRAIDDEAEVERAQAHQVAR